MTEFEDVFISKYLYIIIFALQTHPMMTEKTSNCTIGRKKSDYKHQLDIETERYHAYRENNDIIKSKRDLPINFEEVPYLVDYKSFFESNMDVDEFNVNSFTKGAYTMSKFEISQINGITVTQFKQHMADEDELVQVVRRGGTDQDAKSESVFLPVSL